MIERARKEAQVDELRDKLAKSAVVIFCDYRGLDVPTVTSLRRDFSKEQCEYKVYKNTLIKIALAGTPAEGANALLEGTTAVVFGWEHPASAAKIARSFAKEKSNFRIKGGLLEGKVLDAKAMESVADMPSKEQVRAQLLAALQAPASQLLATLEAGAQQFMYLLDARKRESK